jgi:ANTAR domain/PAS fold
VTTSAPGSAGTFHFSRDSGTWTWSDEVYAIYGFAPGDVVPTTELILAHQHPEDRAEVEQVLADALATGRPHALWHRIRDARGNIREVVMVGAGDFAEDGTLTGCSGFQADLTEAVRRTTAREVDEALELMAQSRPVIEQAKGALMVSYGLDADRAFLLLRRYSQRANVKLRDVARNVVQALADRNLPLGTRPTWDALAAGLVGELVDEPSEERSG